MESGEKDEQLTDDVQLHNVVPILRPCDTRTHPPSCKALWTEFSIGHDQNGSWRGFAIVQVIS